MAASGLLVEIGDRLRMRREELGLTQKDVASLLEISETFYGEIERGNRRLSIKRLVLARDRMGINLTWLLSGEKTGAVMEGIVRQFPGDRQERMESLARNLARLCQR